MSYSFEGECPNCKKEVDIGAYNDKCPNCLHGGSWWEEHCEDNWCMYWYWDEIDGYPAYFNKENKLNENKS